MHRRLLFALACAINVSLVCSWAPFSPNVGLRPGLARASGVCLSRKQPQIKSQGQAGSLIMRPWRKVAPTQLRMAGGVEVVDAESFEVAVQVNLELFLSNPGEFRKQNKIRVRPGCWKCILRGDAQFFFRTHRFRLSATLWRHGVGPANCLGRSSKSLPKITTGRCGF